VTVVPLTLREARAFVAAHHRHNEPPIGHKFSIGLSQDGVLVGCVIASRPTGRGSDDGRTIELIRLTTVGDKNACSRLYSAACRAAAAMGYERAITYTIADEPGTSLRAAGFTADGQTKGGEWTPMDGLLRSAQMPTLFDAPKMPTGPKTRWVAALSRQAEKETA
jgi:hypothetical protein